MKKVPKSMKGGPSRSVTVQKLKVKTAFNKVAYILRVAVGGKVIARSIVGSKGRPVKVKATIAQLRKLGFTDKKARQIRSKFTKKQGYKDIANESLGEKDGKESGKKQSKKSRRNERKGETGHIV